MVIQSSAETNLTLFRSHKRRMLHKSPVPALREFATSIVLDELRCPSCDCSKAMN